MDEGLKVTIPMDRFEQLLDIETRAQILIAETKQSKYAIDREKIALILGFKVEKIKEDF